jgi:hypothetical protein
MNKEIWKPIKGHDGYEISNYGRVKSFMQTSPKILSICTDTLGYERVKLYKDGSYIVQKIHQLVAIHFIPNTKNKPEINHLDGDKSNNHYSNLEWCTRSENMKHACKIGLIKRDGENNPRSKLNDMSAWEILFHHSIGESKQSLADFFNVSKSSVERVIYKKTWKHINLNQIPQ